MNKTKEDLLLDYLQQGKFKGIVTSYDSLPAYLKDDDLTEDLFERYKKSPKKGAGYAKFIANEQDTIAPSPFSATSPFHKRTYSNTELGSPEFHYKFNGYSALNDKINNYLALNFEKQPDENIQPDEKVIALTKDSEVFKNPYTIFSLPEHGNYDFGMDSIGTLNQDTLGLSQRQREDSNVSHTPYTETSLPEQESYDLRMDSIGVLDQDRIWLSKKQKRDAENLVYAQRIKPRVAPVAIDSVDYNTTNVPKLDLQRNKPTRQNQSEHEPFKLPKIEPRKQQGVDFDAMVTNLRQPLRERTSISPWEYKLYEDIELMDPNKFSPYIKDKSCYLNSTEIVANHGYGGNKNKSSRMHVFKLLEEVDGELYYYGDDIADNYQNAINCINRHLDNGRVIIVGVNYAPNLLRNENATDHFIVISGRGFDPILRKHYYTYYEVGSKWSPGYDTVQNRLIYDPENLEFYDPISFRGDRARYDVTQVRPNDGDTTGTVSQDVTNPTKIKNK